MAKSARSRLQDEHVMSKCIDKWTFEQTLSEGAIHVAGVDEAGRGCLAGPVFAAAVILGGSPDNWIGIDDSKRLTKRSRERLREYILLHAVDAAVGVATVQEIDELNILQASRLAMGRAVAGLAHSVDLVLVDGLHTPVFAGLHVAAKPVVDGDALSLSIAAASIIAKVARDAYMSEIAADYPGFGFEHNAGYGTADHLAGLVKYGASPIHRKSFAPVRNVLEQSRQTSLQIDFG